MGVKSIEFTGGGEPTVHPDHIEIFNSVLDSGMDLGLITNGVILKKGFEDVILKGTWCRFSLDAGNSKTYSRIREVPEMMFKKVLNNIKDLVKKKKEINSATTLGISFIVTDQNYNEVYDAAKIASDIGANYFRIGYYRTDEGFVAGDYNKAKALIEKAKSDLSREDFGVIDRYTTSSKNMDGPPDYDFCGYQHVSTWIAADYNVYRCCVTSYDDHGLVGSLKGQSFRELWESESKKERFDSFSARSCTQCIYNDKNRAINFLLHDSPENVNFI
jgi:MoaA/NifB/PqqE/SkfB family radical SAM enzyme